MYISHWNKETKKKTGLPCFAVSLSQHDENMIGQIRRLQPYLIDAPLGDAVAHFCLPLIFGLSVPQPLPRGVYTAE